MAPDSHSGWPSPSRITGTVPLGFIARNSGVSFPPYLWPMSNRSYSSPNSPIHHISACTFDDVFLPHTRIIHFPLFVHKSTIRLLYPNKTLATPCRQAIFRMNDDKRSP